MASMRRTPGFAFLPILPLVFVGCGSSGGPAAAADAGPDASIELDDWIAQLPQSCAFDCANGCPEESTGPFACPSMNDWSKLPHDPLACGSGPTTPTPVTGKCTIAAPTGEALRKAGPVTGQAGTWVLPDGHRMTPAGAEALLADDVHVGGFSVSIAVVPSTHYALVVDAGFGEHLVRSIDLTALAAGGTNVIMSTVQVPRATWGLAVRAGAAGKHTAYVAGGDSGKVNVLDVDDATGVLTLGTPIDLGSQNVGGKMQPFFSQGLAVTPDGKRLVVGSVKSPEGRVVSLEAGSSGSILFRPLLGGAEQYGAFVDPADTSGEVAYVPLWGSAKVVVLDLATGMVKQSIPTGKNPQGIAFLDARWMVVADADGDALTVVDRVAQAAVATLPIAQTKAGDPPALRGYEPSTIAWDATTKRLYVTEAVINAVEVFDVDLSGSAPVLASRGRIPTAWWPTDVALDAGGSRLLVLSGRGHGVGSGRTGKRFDPGNGEIAESMHGSLQSIDLASLDLAALGQLTAQVRKNADLASVGGYPTPGCPAGADDFPVPATNTQGASKTIKHVVFVVRENKDFDGVFGDLGGEVDGKPDLVLAPGRMPRLYANLRGIAKRWTVADNYYTDAEYSNQGHVWTTYGRTTDFVERTWMIGAAGYGRDAGGGLTDAGRAEEGSVFEWLVRQKFEFDILGEGTGLPAPPTDGSRNPLDVHYPGIAQNIGLEDVTKSCYFAARARVKCDLHGFVYMTLPNDHTFGGGGGRPTPETMIAVNDEATGAMLDALGRSPFWQDTLVIVTEDDPIDGGDHVDLHRTPIVFAGPWVKQGYVAHGHYDVASLIKLFANIHGLPYPNEVVARAPLPLEMFTSTPDYATWTVIPRTEPRACNGTSSSFAYQAQSWDFEQIDEQPGLGAQVRRMLRATPAERGPMLPIVPGAPKRDD
jgi:YVTN family beta-propeller protein